MYKYSLSIVGLIMFLACAGCTDLTQYRTKHDVPCDVETPDSCKDATIEDHKVDNYSLAFVEFDDQGSLWDREQLDMVINRIDQEGEKPNGLLLVVFIHGWKNNAEFENGNVKDFRESLSELARLEKEAESSKYQARNIMGLYVGWRGLSVYAPGIKEFTFWDRKNAAERVGHGAVTEFLIKIENAARRAKVNNGYTDLVIIGHSFGGSIIYSALSQIMMERMTIPDNQNRGFGDLVVMLNPAIEAARFTPLQQLAATQKYSEGSYPILVILTSEADWATKKTFKMGRICSTLFDAYRKDVPQRKENVTAVGHYQQYITHELIPLDEENENKEKSVWDENFSWEKDTFREGYVVNIGKTQLIHKKGDAMHKSTPGNPIMVISVDRKVMSDHNDIFNERLRSFLADLILTKP